MWRRDAALGGFVWTVRGPTVFLCHGGQCEPYRWRRACETKVVGGSESLNLFRLRRVVMAKRPSERLVAGLAVGFRQFGGSFLLSDLPSP